MKECKISWRRIEKEIREERKTKKKTMYCMRKQEKNRTFFWNKVIWKEGQGARDKN
jgi:hypothetical protein